MTLALAGDDPYHEPLAPRVREGATYMRRVILTRTNFRRPGPGWRWPADAEGAIEATPAGCVVSAGGKKITFDGPGVPTCNGDSIELTFELPARGRGRVSLAYSGGFEHIRVTLDPARRTLSLDTSEWNRRQPVATAAVKLSAKGPHTIRIDKTRGPGRLVPAADLRVHLDGQCVLEAPGINALPEMGVFVSVEGGRAVLRRFVHRGTPTGVGEFLRVGGWQMLNVPDIDANLASLGRGLRAAAERGVRLLVTPETSLTGLFPKQRVTGRRGAVAEAERKLQRTIARLKDAPYVVVGLPVWRAGPNGRPLTRYNASRVYDGDGRVIHDGAKVHSCESDFWHGYRLNEFEVDGVKTCMHVCHDGRYPELWTLPIMFGARLVVHPSNGGTVGGTVAGFRGGTARSTGSMHAFYVRVNGGGGSCIAGPTKHDNVLAVSDECLPDNPDAPRVGKPVECLLEANLRIHDAFGYWPVRSMRASEAAAAAYAHLYRALGGSNAPTH